MAQVLSYKVILEPCEGGGYTLFMCRLSWAIFRRMIPLRRL